MYFQGIRNLLLFEVLLPFKVQKGTHENPLQGGEALAGVQAAPRDNIILLLRGLIEYSTSQQAGQILAD
jgi:hypothetical protein